MNISSQIESILFFKAEPVSVKELAKIFDQKASTMEEALEELKNDLHHRGIRLMRNNDDVMLVTAPEMSTVIEYLQKDERERDLSKAAVETLTTIVYSGPISRADIDHIRGVNSTFILRQLTVRGLIERITNPHDQRSFLYQPTLDLLANLGVTSTQEMPEYEVFRQQIAEFTTSESSDKTTISDSLSHEE